MDIEEQYDKIYRFCFFKLRDAHLAEDITQETFLRFLESKNYKDTGRPLAFLYTIAGNLCIDEFRRKKASELPEDMPGQEFEDGVINRVALKQAMAQLTSQEQELLLLRYVNEVPVNTLSKMYGKSRFALYRELSNITRKLERRLGS